MSGTEDGFWRESTEAETNTDLLLLVSLNAVSSLRGCFVCPDQLRASHSLCLSCLVCLPQSVVWYCISNISAWFMFSDWFTKHFSQTHSSQVGILIAEIHPSSCLLLPSILKIEFINHISNSNVEISCHTIRNYLPWYVFNSLW